VNARLALRWFHDDLVASARAGVVMVQRVGGGVPLDPGDVDAYLLGDPLPSQEARKSSVNKLDAIGARLAGVRGQRTDEPLVAR
jgi:hypothetical protein